MFYFFFTSGQNSISDMDGLVPGTRVRCRITAGSPFGYNYNAIYILPELNYGQKEIMLACFLGSEILHWKQVNRQLLVVLNCKKVCGANLFLIASFHPFEQKPVPGTGSLDPTIVREQSTLLVLLYPGWTPHRSMGLSSQLHHGQDETTHQRRY